ncbi:MAG: hypothetical protein M1816_000856 [Peltula sp. TS41687]|nr:MAG: hypothetical protein M1816_000856 [Peltula sp. TS41687]
MSSPKRKRGDHDPDTSSAPHTPSRERSSAASDPISFPRRLFQGFGSPREKIIRQFRELKIKDEDIARKIDWEKGIPQPSKREVNTEETKSKRMKQAPKKKSKLGKTKEARSSKDGILDIAQPTPQLKSQAEAAPTSNPSMELFQRQDQHPTGDAPKSTSGSENDEEEDEKEGWEVAPSKKTHSRRQKATAHAMAMAKQENLLTWQEHEITGHFQDDPDDDGEGLNGIGFIPTPAMAYARTEKRRQQIQEYRNREAREARRLRGERRRGEKVSKPVSEARRVRFAEVGSG